jgi:membrane-associated PAP2 superfamily phosphatase
MVSFQLMSTLQKMRQTSHLILYYHQETLQHVLGNQVTGAMMHRVMKNLLMALQIKLLVQLSFFHGNNAVTRANAYPPLTTQHGVEQLPLQKLRQTNSIIQMLSIQPPRQ